MRRATVLLLKAGLLERYGQESFEARKRLEESRTYPGPIRAATPGDTRFYAGSLESILQDTDRHYWRAVTDDPQVQYLIPLRIRFKVFTWVTTGWEQRLQVVQIMAPKDSTIGQVIELVTVENQSPYLCLSTFTLSMDGKELDPEKTLSDYEITEHSRIDAIENQDHLLHKDSERPRDWTVDEITSERLNHSPYKEMCMQPLSNLAPRYEARPKGYFGRNNYSGLMDIRKETKSVLALADNVIASIGDGFSGIGTKPFQPVETANARVIPSRGTDKLSQTETCVLSRAIQHSSTTNVRTTQTASSSHHRAAQTEFSRSCSATQTEADASPDLIREAFKSTTGTICTRLVQMENLWVKLVDRVDRCSSELRRMRDRVALLCNSRDILSETLKDTQAALNATNLLQMELEDRSTICGEEHVSWCNMIHIAHRNLVASHRKTEAAFFVVQSELFEKLDEIDSLQRELYDRDKSTITTGSNEMFGCCHCTAERGNVEDRIENDPVKEMKKLLSECWSVLGQEA